MRLGVDVDPSLVFDVNAVQCDGCDGACTNSSTCTCAGDLAQDLWLWATLPGTLVIQLQCPYAEYAGWAAELEVDLGAETARLCQIEYTDNGCEPRTPFDVRCATSGGVTLSRAPAAEGEIAGLAGTIDATFDDGLRLQAEFVVE